MSCKEEITYNADEKTYNKDSYVLSSNFDSSKGGKSIDKLRVVYTIADGFSFSADGKVNVMNSLINSSYLTDTWEFSNESLTVYPISNIDISELGYFSIIVKLYEGDKLIKNTPQRIPIKVIKTPEKNPDDINGIKITNKNINDFLNQNGDLVITDGEYLITEKVSCNNLYVKGGQLSITGSLNVAGNAEVTGGKTNWLNPISQDVCGGVLAVYGTLNIKGNMTVGTDSGVLEMTNSKAVVDVAGDFKITANSTMYRSKLSAGVLKIGGSFESSGKDSGNFKAEGSHITHFYSNDGFSINMNTKNNGNEKNSFFNNLTFTDSAVINFDGTLYSFNVNGYFKKNNTANANYTKGDELNHLLIDYTASNKAENVLTSKYEQLYNSTSLLKTSLNTKLKNCISSEWINKISADTEMFFQMSVMNKANDIKVSIEGVTINIKNFSEEIVYENVPFGNNSTVDIYVTLDVTGSGVGSSNGAMCSATWYAIGKDNYITDSAVLTYVNSESLYSDLYKIFDEQAHTNDYWFWFKEIANDFLSGISSVSGANVKSAKTVISIIDKCYSVVKNGNLNTFKISSGNKALSIASKLNQIANGKSKWITAIFCPVDVEINDSSNNIVGSIVDNNVIVSTNKVTMTAVGDKKYCSFNEYDKYSIKLTATGTGTMDYIVDEVNNNSTYRRITFEKLPLTPDTVYTGSIECVEMQSDDSYKLTDNHNNVFAATSDIIDFNGNINSLIVSTKPNPTLSVPSGGSNGNQGSSAVNSTSSISTSFDVKIENKITGETCKVNVTQTGKNITVNFGKENNGYYANIYDTDGNLLDSVKIKSGKAKFTIQSDIDFYIVIDKDSHMEYEDVSSGAGIYELFEEKKEHFCMLIIIIAALGFLSVVIVKRYQKNKH